MKAGMTGVMAALLAVAGLVAGCRTGSAGRLGLEQRQSMAQADFQRAVRLAHAGKQQRAISALASGLDLYPEHLASRLFLAGLLQESGNGAAALDQYDQALKLIRNSDTNSMDRVVVYGNRGDCFVAQGRFEEAEADFTKALELKPKETALIYKRGEARMGLKRYEAALADFTTVTKVMPHEAEGWMRRGDCQFAVSNFSEAADDYSVALERSPRDANLFARRAAIFAALDQNEMALADYTRALDLEPDSARRWYDRAITHLALDQAKEALSDLTEALKRDPKRPEILVARGMALELSGDTAAALADYNMARNVSPNYEPAERNRKRLMDRTAAAGR